MEDHEDPNLRKDVPALVVPDDRWREAAAALIERAAIVVVEVSIETDAIGWELGALRHFGREHDTVLVMSAPGTGGFRYSQFDWYSGFNRIVFFHELPSLDLFQHPSSRDLFWTKAYLPALGNDPSKIPAMYSRWIDRRTEYLGVIEGLAKIASVYASTGDHVVAVKHCEAAIDIARVIVAKALASSLEEMDALICCGILAAKCHFRMGEVGLAQSRIDLAKTLATSNGLLGHNEEIAKVETQLAT